MALGNYSYKDYSGGPVKLASPEYKPTEFQYVDFKWNPLDPSIPQKAMDKMDEANEKALQKETEIDAFYAEERKKVHNDPISLQIFDDKVNKYKQEIKNSVDANLGSYHRLGSVLQRLAGEAASDKAINGMMRQNERYEETRKEINSLFDSGKITDVRRDRLLYQLDKRYDNNFLKDESGEIIGVGAWDNRIDIVENYDSVKMAALIASITAPQKRSSGGTTTTIGQVDKNGNPVASVDYSSADKYNTSTSKGKRTSIDELSPESLQKTFDLLKETQPEIIRQFQAEYEDLVFEYDDGNKKLSQLEGDEKARLQSRVNELDTLLHGTGAGGGGKISDREYFITKFGKLVEQQSYKNTDTTTNNETSIKDNTGINRSGNGSGDEVKSYLEDLSFESKPAASVRVEEGSTINTKPSWNLSFKDLTYAKPKPKIKK